MQLYAFEQLTDALPEPTLLVSGLGSVIAANGPARALLDSAVLLGGTIFELCSSSPEPLAQFLKACSRVRHPMLHTVTLRSGRRCRLEGAVVQPRSDAAPAVLLLRLLDEDDSAFAGFRSLNEKLECLRREMGRKRLAELELSRQREWLRVTLLSIADAVIATDARGLIVFMNPAAESLTGWEERDASGRSVADVFRIFQEVTREPVEDPALQVLRGGEPIGAGDSTFLLARDGTEWPLDANAAPIRGPGGEVMGAVLVFREIKGRRALERLAKQRLEELTIADQRKNEFLAMLAHELRNPLAPILAATAVLRVKGVSADAVERVSGVIERQVHQMTRLVDDLLDVSRITLGKIQLRNEVVDVGRVLQHAVETSRPIIEAHEHELCFSIDASLPSIVADPTRLEQIVCNLLNNAAKYTHKGGRIWLSARAHEGEVVISVRDTGIGIPRELLPRLFDAFVQGDRSLHRSQGGLGIGLTLVKHLVALHGGSCACLSGGPGQGAEFVVRLPLAAPA